VNSPSDEFFHAAQVGVVDWNAGIGVERQVQAAQHEVGSLVSRVVRAMTVVQAGGAEAARGLHDQLAELQGRSLRSTSR
jgi:hypothetical protein